MKTLVLDGWRPSFNKVALTKLLQSEAGLSLAEAKQNVDRLLEGNEVSLAIPDTEDVDGLRRRVDEIGASSHVPTGAETRP